MTELQKITRKIFFGWVISSYSKKDREQMTSDILDQKEALSNIPLSDIQLLFTKNFEEKIPLDWFRGEAKQTVKIARENEISIEDIYEMYIIGSIDFILSQIYGESESFAHLKLTEEEQLEICWKFILGMISESLNPSFKAEMTAKEAKAIRLAQEKGVDKNDIINLIIKSNNDAISFNSFQNNLPTIINIFKLGGINDEKEIFWYFKMFLAHLFYKLGA